MSVFFLLVSIFGAGTNFGARIEGVVRDSKTKEFVPSASVYLEGTALGTATNDNGFYRLENVPAGEYYLSASIIGYRPFRQLVVVSGSNRLFKNISLVSEIITMPGIQVTGHRTDFLREVKPSSFKITPREMGIPPPFIEGDLFRTLQTLPGVVTVSDFSSALYVRGSSPDQNLVLLDGAPVYNPFHLGGLFSTFEIDALESAEFLTGGFPAEYGGNLASVLDVRTYPGDTIRYRGLVGASILGSRAQVEGPLPKGSFLLSGRYTYFDKVLPLFGITFPYYFYDGQGAVRFHPFPKTVVKLTGFLSNDDFHMAETGLNLGFGWGNRAASLNLTQIFTDKVFTQLTAASSRLRTNLIFGDLFNIDNSINDGLVQDATTIEWGEHDLKFGFEYKHTDFYYMTKIMNLVDDTILGRPDYGALFAEATLRPWPVLIIEPGIRLDSYRISYTETKTYAFPDPRLGVKYFITPSTALKVSFGRFHQFIGSTMPEEGMMPIYFWIPIYDEHPPQEAYHYIFGIERLTRNEELTAEVYYKNLSSLLIFNGDLDPNNMPATVFTHTRGKAYGLDILAKEQRGRFQGWITYSLGYSLFEQNNVEYYTSFDRRHSLSLIGAYQFPRGWTASLRFNLGSGLSYTGAIGRYRRISIDPFRDDYRYNWTEIGGPKNGLRYPLYHRLDFNFEKDFKLPLGNLTVTGQVINVYNQHNVFLYYYDYRVEPPIRRSVTMIPLIGSLSLELKF